MYARGLRPVSTPHRLSSSMADYTAAQSTSTACGRLSLPLPNRCLVVASCRDQAQAEAQDTVMKPTFARDSWIVTTLISLALPAHAQTLPQSSPQNTSSRTLSEAVLLDVVVRDKRGRLVTHLTPEDFQIFDNGESRPIDSFRLVQGTEEITTRR